MIWTFLVSPLHSCHTSSLLKTYLSTPGCFQPPCYCSYCSFLLENLSSSLPPLTPFLKYPHTPSILYMYIICTLAKIGIVTLLRTRQGAPWPKYHSSGRALCPMSVLVLSHQQQVLKKEQPTLTKQGPCLRHLLSITCSTLLNPPNHPLKQVLLCGDNYPPFQSRNQGTERLSNLYKLPCRKQG